MGTFNFWAQEVTEHRKSVWRISRNILSTLQDYRTFSLLPPLLNDFPFHQDIETKPGKTVSEKNEYNTRRKAKNLGRNASSLNDFRNSIVDK